MEQEQTNPQENTPPTIKKVEKGDVIQAPPWCNLEVNEIIPMKGWNFKCIGYTQLFEPVFQCVGPTGKTADALSNDQLGKVHELIKHLQSKPRPAAKPVEG